MRIVLYDKKPGDGFGQWLLMLSWAVGSLLQKWFGPVDARYGASSWEDALQWISTRPEKVTSIQYWGHGSRGRVWLAQLAVMSEQWLQLKPYLAENALLWFRTCSTLQGHVGQEFSRILADGLNCTVAGHTRIIGLRQGGLHTRKPNTQPSWPETEGELPGAKWPYLEDGNNSITFLSTKIPDGW